jgi:hypothetical protein
MIPAVLPLGLLVAGGLAIGAGWLVMRRLGDRTRIGRILAATPVVSVDRARAMASEGARRYVSVLGRVDAAEEFEDEHHRPLVFRRTRLEARTSARWTTLEDVRQSVPFAITETLASIAVDADALDDGLVVVDRVAEGTAAEIGDRIPVGTSPATPVRLRIQQLSSVDHAFVLGVPMLDADRGPILRPGLGRPLILTNLERDEAMRVLAGGRRRLAGVVIGLLAAGVALVLLGVVWGLVDVLA